MTNLLNVNNGLCEILYTDVLRSLEYSLWSDLTTTRHIEQDSLLISIGSQMKGNRE